MLITSVIFVYANPSISGERITIVSLTSLQFQNMFTKGHLVQHIRASYLQGTQNYRNIQLSLKVVVSLINENGGWTIYGWGKRGLINDTSLLGQADTEENKALSKEVTTHVLHLHPKNDLFADSNSYCYKSHQELKFDLSTIA